MAASSSLSSVPASTADAGIELTARKSAQFSTRELGEDNGELSNGSEADQDADDAMKSTNVDRYNMDRMGKLCNTCRYGHLR